MSADAQRYTAVAILLHWAIAVAILANFAIGWWMHGAIDVAESQARAVAAFQIHKSIGLTVLALSLLRLGWRLAHPPPALPAHMPKWERMAAKVTHWLFYGLMIGIPLSGWLYVSTQWRGDTALNVPTLWFGVFEVPHLFGLNDATNSLRDALSGIVFEAHEILAWSAMGLLGLHVAAALKHQFIDRDLVLSHMVPALENTASTGQLRKWSLRGGMLLITLALAAVLVMFFKTPAGSDGAEVAISAVEGSWAIDASDSEIAFSGVHAGAAFTGRFTRWQTDIHIDPQDPMRSRISATIETASAEDGMPLHNKTLPQKEWFNAEAYPTADFQSSRISELETGRYRIEGALTIKGHEIPVNSLLLELDNDIAVISGEFIIDRESADLGMESDPGGQWVSKNIDVAVRAQLTRSAAN